MFLYLFLGMGEVEVLGKTTEYKSWKERGVWVMWYRVISLQPFCMRRKDQETQLESNIARFLIEEGIWDASSRVREHYMDGGNVLSISLRKGQKQQE